MAAIRQLQTNFSSGQLDPRMAGREDTSVYQNGGANLLNSSPLVQGGISRRPGTKYLAALQGTSRLARMQFNETQLYIFAFSNARLDIFDEDGAAVANLTSQPWNATTMWEMRLDTSGDTTFIVHKDFPIQKLIRTGASSFTIAAFTFETHSSGYPRFQPYYKFADPSVTITPSGTSGSINLTTSADYWVAAHVNSVVRVAGKECDVTSRTNATVVVATVRESLAGTGATNDWDENVFSAANGYARSVAFHQQRLWFGGSRDLPSNIWSSQKGAFFNFNVGEALDAESIQVDIGSATVNEIKHLHSSRHLQVFTDQSCGFIVESDTNPVSPTNFIHRSQVPYGCSNVTPRSLDGATLFVQDTGKVVRELIFSDVQQAYTAQAVSLISNDIIDGAKDMAVLYGSSAGPEQFALIVNTDTEGSIAAFHSIRSEKISGWFPWQTDGKFISVAQLNSEIFVCVERVVNSSTVYYLEKFDFNQTVDSYAPLSQVSGLVYGGLTHLNAKSASVVDGNIHHGDFTVASSGRVTLIEAPTSAVGGLNYTRTIIDLPVDIADGAGPFSGEYKRVGRVVLNVYESVSFSVNGRDFLIRQVTDDLSINPAAKTGKYEFNLLGWDLDGQITISQSSPLPFTLLSIYKEVWV